MGDTQRNPETDQAILYEDFLTRCAALAEAVPMTAMDGAVGELSDDTVEKWYSDDPLERGEAYLAWRESEGFAVQETEDGEIVEIPFTEL